MTCSAKSRIRRNLSSKWMLRLGSHAGEGGMRLHTSEAGWKFEMSMEMCGEIQLFLK
jgi:hypothetical protein